MAGKTTLLNCINGLFPNTTGDVSLAGASLRGQAAHKRVGLGIARTFQSPGPFASLRTWEYVAIGVPGQNVAKIGSLLLRPRHSLRLEREAHDVAVLALESFGLAETADKLVSELSYGAQKVVDLVRVTVSNPAVALLDEPTAGTGADDRQQVIASLRNMHHQRPKMTTLIIDHDISFIRQICPRIVVMELGRVLRDGAADAVLGAPDVADILGVHDDVADRPSVEERLS
jgi:branched-chain amino acid transport system ATP-binding protein